MTLHPQFDNLRDSIAGAPSERWSGIVFRCVDPKWARPGHLVSGQGTMTHGGRWMAPGVQPVVHAATTEGLALKESRGRIDDHCIRRPKRMPRVLVELTVSVGRVLHLVKMDEALSPITVDELLYENWEKLNDRGKESLSQALGRAVMNAGFEGMLVPSARDRRARNLIWFPENLAAGSRIEISGQDQLDRWIAE